MEMNFALSDNLDNVNPKNQYQRIGDAKNDRFLYSSFGISYNLKTTRQQPKQLFQQFETPTDDEDGDGVADFYDRCPFTPEGVQVTPDGCPVDTDKDGVADYLDQEPMSADGAPVDEFGVTITDEMFTLRYEAFMDTVGDLQLQKTQIATADVPSLKFGKRTKGYSVEIVNADNLSADEIAGLLSIPDIHVEEIDGKVYYLAGHFDSLRNALIRKIQLENDALQVRVVRNDFGVISDISQEAALAEAELREQAQNDPSLTAAFAGESKVIFRVQIGAYRYRLSGNIFTNVSDLVVIEGNDGLTRYVSGSFDNIQEAAKRKIDLLLEGFEGAFVTAYKDGKRISLKEAGATMASTAPEEPNLDATAGGNFNPELINFTVQLGMYSGRIPANVLSEYLKIGTVKPVRGVNGVTRYVSGSYDTFAEAEKALEELKAKGYPDAFVVGEFNGQVIDAAEAKRMKQH